MVARVLACYGPFLDVALFMRAGLLRFPVHMKHMLTCHVLIPFTFCHLPCL